MLLEITKICWTALRYSNGRSSSEGAPYSLSQKKRRPEGAHRGGFRDRKRDRLRKRCCEREEASGSKGAISPVRKALADDRTWRVFETFRPAVSEIRALRLGVQAALYWIGSAAEHAVLERIPGIAKEEHYNSGLVHEVEDVVEEIGYKLFQDLG